MTDRRPAPQSTHGLGGRESPTAWWTDSSQPLIGSFCQKPTRTLPSTNQREEMDYIKTTTKINYRQKNKQERGTWHVVRCNSSISSGFYQSLTQTGCFSKDHNNQWYLSSEWITDLIKINPSIHPISTTIFVQFLLFSLPYLWTKWAF